MRGPSPDQIDLGPTPRVLERKKGPLTTLHCVQARKLLGWPKRCKLAHEFLWEYSCKRLKLAQLLGQLGVFLTLVYSISNSPYKVY